jgi:MYXO-CTERM domain-containing protein
MKTLLPSLASVSSRGPWARARKPVTSLAALTLAFGAVAASAVAAHAGAPAPVQIDSVESTSDPYANASSPFGADMHLLRQDDILLTLGNENASAASMQNRWLSTIDSPPGSGTQCAMDTGCDYTYAAYDLEQSSAVGRFFDTPSDSIVQFPSYPSSISGRSPTGGFTFDTLTAGTKGYALASSQALPYGTNATTTARSAIGDFNGDGYDDVLMVYSDWRQPFGGNGRARIAHAVDTSDPSKGFTFGPESSLGISTDIRSVAVGDFNNDGKPEVAVLYVDDNRFPNIAIYSVDAGLALHLQEVNTVADPVDWNAPDMPGQLLAGTFRPGGGQQLVMAVEEEYKTSLRVFGFTNPDSPFYPYEKGKVLLDNATRVKLAAGRFDWSAPTDSIAVMASWPSENKNSTSTVQVINVDPTSLRPAVAATVDVQKDLYETSDRNYVALDIAVGDFANTSGTGSPTIPNPNEQIAIATGYVDGKSAGIQQFQAKDVFTMNVAPNTAPADGGAPSSLAVTKFSQTPVKFTLPGSSGKVTYLSIAPADLQGRSLRLGPGYKLAINSVSPTMMLAQPPSHVDAVVGADGTYDLVNKTMTPTGFSANYQSQSGTNVSDSETDTHGWAEGVQNETAIKFRAGTKSDNLHVGGSYSFGSELNKRTDATYGTQIGVTKQYSTSTATNDVVLYDDGTTYLWTYQIVGKDVCLDGSDTCDVKYPATITFTTNGPKRTTLASAETLPWYQPVWENGNLLSYPTSEKQLFAGTDRPLTLNTPLGMVTDLSSATETTTWAGSQSQGSSVNSSETSKQSGSFSLGFTAGWPEGRLDVDGTTKWDLSDQTGHLATKNASISASTALGIKKGASFKIEYGFTPYIFGENAPPDYFTVDDPNFNWTQPISSNGIQSFGPTRTAFVVDPMSYSGRRWWRDTYGPSDGTFDVALNHPVRWRNLNTVTWPRNNPDNCVANGTGYMDCAIPNGGNAANPADDFFHAMRGFFVFPKQSANPQPNPANFDDQGMQAQLATEGDTVTLETRVYNYSLNAMPAGTVVHANFYAMPWGDDDAPADGGKSFLVKRWSSNEGIQPFANKYDVPNYTIASADFDTHGHSGDYAFWVVVWAEDANGKMVGELPGKGLASNPGSLESTTYSDFVALEPTTANHWRAFDSDPDTVSFSNNIGFYENIFHIIPSSSAVSTLAKPLPSGPSGSINALTVEALDLPHTVVERGDLAGIQATIDNRGAPMQIVTAYFYDGDPDKGGAMVAARRVPYLASGARRRVQVQYAPSACGTHDIYMEVLHDGLATKKVEAVQTIQVDCSDEDDAGVLSTLDVDGGTTGPGDGGTTDAGNNEAPKDGEGGCSVAPGSPSGGGLGWLAPLGMVVTSFLARRKRKA